MNKLDTIIPNVNNATQAEAELTSIIAQIDRIDERIERDQQETARLRAETRKILEKLVNI